MYYLIGNTIYKLCLKGKINGEIIERVGEMELK